MKSLLLIFGLALSLGVFAAGDEKSRMGQDLKGCGGKGELKGCKCIKQDLAPKDGTPKTLVDPEKKGKGAGA